MPMVTTDEFIAALKEKGYLGRPVLTKPDEPVGVNVWIDESIAPATTVWWPRPNNPTDQIVWGRNFDKCSHTDITAESLVERVEEGWV
jgi:hypothetical protein